MNILNTNKAKLETLNKIIQDENFATFTQKELNDEFEKCDDYEYKIVECIQILKSLTVNNRRSSSPSNLSFQHNSSMITQYGHTLKVPTVPLPTFNSSENEDLTTFLFEFEEIVSKYSLQPGEKFGLLHKHVWGEAKLLLNSLEPSKKTYEEAKALLENALASPSIRVNKTINQLCELKLNYDANINEFIAKLRNIIINVRQTLKLSVDDFLTFFVWNALNNSFQQHLIALTNKSKPDIDLIMDNIFAAAERYRAQQTFFQNRRSEKTQNLSKTQRDSNQNKSGHARYNSFAAGVRYNKTNNDSDNKENTQNSTINKSPFVAPCLFCFGSGEDSNHIAAKCSKFESPKSKIEQLIKLKACSKCAYLNHSESNCKFRFRTRCNNCKQWHFTFLCTSEKTAVNNASKNVESQNTLITGMHSNSSSFSSGSILPTFSAKLSGKENIRCLKDGGSQMNFILERVAARHNFKVIEENVKITVRGFNSSKVYNSKIVEVKLGLSERLETVQAVCIPAINIRLELPGLSRLVKNIKSQGHKLADIFFNYDLDYIAGIEFVLGSGSAHILIDQQIGFGPRKDAIVAKTDIGLMLHGNVNNLYANLNYLPKPSMQNSHGDQTVNVETKNKTNDKTGDQTKTKQHATKNQPSNTSTPSTKIQTQTLLSIDEKDNLNEIATNTQLSVIDENGAIIENKLKQATNEILENLCKDSLNYDTQNYEESSVELNDKLVQYALDNTTRDAQGRLEICLLCCTHQIFISIKIKISVRHFIVECLPV